MERFTHKTILEHLVLLGPPLDKSKVAVFSCFRDEMYFAPAFFDHYRSLGAEQFLIFDDQSTDGTAEFLDAQPDCIRVTSTMRFGDKIDVRYPNGKERVQRAGTFLKGAIPRGFLRGVWSLYVDADEFLLLPQGVGSLRQIQDRMDQSGQAAVIASVVEFFPNDYGALFSDRKAKTIDDLLKGSPYFEAVQLFELLDGKKTPKFLGPSKTTELFERFGFRDRLPSAQERSKFKDIFRLKKRWKEETYSASARHRTALVKHDDDVYFIGSHNTNKPANHEVVLTLAHFVFTSNFPAKVERAIKWSSHAHDAEKYIRYKDLLERMKDSKDGFLTPNSVKYTGPEQLIDARLMVWPEVATDDKPMLSA